MLHPALRHPGTLRSDVPRNRKSRDATRNSQLRGVGHDDGGSVYQVNKVNLILQKPFLTRDVIASRSRLFRCFKSLLIHWLYILYISMINACIYHWQIRLITINYHYWSTGALWHVLSNTHCVAKLFTSISIPISQSGWIEWFSIPRQRTTKLHHLLSAQWRFTKWISLVFLTFWFEPQCFESIT